MPQKILIADTNRQVIETLREALERLDYEVLAAYTVNEARHRLRDKAFHLLILGQNFVAGGGQDFLRFLGRENPGLPGILLAGKSLPETTRRFLAPLPFVTLRWSQGLSLLLRTVEALGSAGGPETGAAGSPPSWGHPWAQPLLGETGAMRQLRETLKAVARTEATVLLRGETGTGKELAARWLHASGRRIGRPFVTVNCAALSESLLESELFGHEKGSFTGAHRQKMGKFEYAGSGTLFLDEIGEMSPHLQAKMLRILDHREFERVGGNRTLKVTCRILAASNIDFSRALAEGRFREDLYYRLNVVAIDLPPLRERKEDIPLLARHFLEDKSRRHGKSLPPLPRAFLDRMRDYPWPGNVRELEHVIEQAVILARGRRYPDLRLPALAGGSAFSGPATAADAVSSPPFDGNGRGAPSRPDPETGLPLPEPDPAMTLRDYRDRMVDACERAYFDRMLRLHRGHISRTAEAAGIDRKTFYRKIERLGLNPRHYKTGVRS